MSKNAVVILNWNGKHHLVTFLPSVVKYTTQSDVIVIDNQSTDESISFLKELYPTVKLIFNSKNFGFALGYNEGLNQIKGEYENYILINSDLEVTEHWEAPLLEKLKDTSIAVCQPKVLSYKNKSHYEYAGASGGFVDKLGYMFCRGRIFDEVEANNPNYVNAQEIFWATGCCFAIKANLFHEQNGFDADYYAHMEEIDLCWRLKHKGYQIWVEPKSVVYHLGGGSLQYESPFKTYLNFRNNLLLIIKNDFSPWLFFKITFRLKLDGLAAIRFLLKGQIKNCLAIIHAHFGFYKRLSSFLKKRKEQKQHIKTYNKIGIYNRSLLFDYFLKGKKKYSDLAQEAFNS